MSNSAKSPAAQEATEHFETGSKKVGPGMAQGSLDLIGAMYAGARFEQAKNSTKSAQFLQIVAKPKPAARKKPEPKLTRVAFKVSRLMEFCSERELQNQTGHSLWDWPLVVGKEVMNTPSMPAKRPRLCPTSRSSSIQEQSLDETQLDRVRTEKQKSKMKSGDFTDDDEVEP
jgi:hypothetical protein